MWSWWLLEGVNDVIGVVFDFIKKVLLMPVFEFALDFTESSTFDCYDYND